MENSVRFEDNVAELTQNQKEIRTARREAAQIRKETAHIIKEIKEIARSRKPTDTPISRLERTVHAMAATYGIESETSFREALSGILGDAGLEVENYIKQDMEGRVHGHPAQVELDVVVRDGKLMLVEIKSSMSRSEVYTFERVVEFYEAQENRKVDRKLIVCPFFKPGAIDVAEKLGIEVFTDVTDVL